MTNDNDKNGKGKGTVNKNEPTQEELGRFVRNNVILCQSSLVDQLLAKEVFSWDDVTNMYQFNEDDAIYDILEEIKSDDKNKEFQKHIKNIGVKSIYELDKEGLEELINELDLSICLSDYEEPAEIFEWWVVDSWLEGQLEAEGEAILDNDYGTWWGRCTTGQAILLDGIISRIYKKHML